MKIKKWRIDITSNQFKNPRGTFVRTYEVEAKTQEHAVKICREAALKDFKNSLIPLIYGEMK
jgi:hypothetical protein